MNNFLTSSDVLLALQQEKNATRKELRASLQRIQDTTNRLTAPLPKAANRAQNITRFVSNGFALYKGYRVCTGILSAVASLFGRRRRRR